jgi:predicted GNAT superfamily acetyltransferase
MDDAVALRPIMPDDVDRILEINEANVPDVGPVDQPRLEYLIDESAIAIAVELEGDVVGFCLVFADQSSYDSINYLWFRQQYPRSMYLDRVAFDSAAQGRGLGTALYAEVDRRLRTEHDADGLGLEVNVDPPNETSLRFHDKLGFVEVGRQMSKGIEVSLMHRPLD